jgi:hypothetical protein
MKERKIGAQTFVFLQIYVCLHRHLEYAGAIRTKDRARFPEQKNSISTRLLKENSLTFIEDEFL